MRRRNRMMMAWLVLPAMLLVGVSCVPAAEPRADKAIIAKHIDREWFRQSVVRDNLAPRLKAVRTDSGFFRAALDEQWRPAKTQTGTLVSQSRLLFVMSTGYDVTGDKAYLQAVRKGADFFLKHFRDTEHGGCFWRISPDGKVIDDRKRAYGHSFVIFGLSHACRVTGDARYGKAAAETWEAMKTKLSDRHGGILSMANRDFSRKWGNSQNPTMHLFEALLALHDATGSKKVLQDAKALARFVFGRLYQKDGGYMPEVFDADWKPLPDDKKGYVHLGHQVEWAFLLSRAVRKGFGREYLKIGERLLDYAMKHGYDKANGGLFTTSDYSGRVKNATKGRWQQCELLRALMRYAAEHGRSDLWGPFDKTLALVRKQFIDAEYHGWYDSYNPQKSPARGGRYKGSVWKTGYHTAGMYAEAIRLTEGKK